MCSPSFVPSGLFQLGTESRIVVSDRPFEDFAKENQMRNVPLDCVQIGYWVLPERTHLTIEGISAKERIINGLMW